MCNNHKSQIKVKNNNMYGLISIGQILGVVAALYYMSSGNVDLKLLAAVIAGYIGGGYAETYLTGSSM